MFLSLFTMSMFVAVFAPIDKFAFHADNGSLVFNMSNAWLACPSANNARLLLSVSKKRASCDAPDDAIGKAIYVKHIPLSNTPSLFIQIGDGNDEITYATTYTATVVVEMTGKAVMQCSSQKEHTIGIDTLARYTTKAIN